MPISYIADEGANFNEHFDSAFKQLWLMGYESAVSIGGDLPQMPINNLVQAFHWLRHFEQKYNGVGLVHCPCQACGVSLVGITRATPMDFDGIFYNLDGVSALDGIINTAHEKGLRCGLGNRGRHRHRRGSCPRSEHGPFQEYTSRFQPGVMIPRRFLAWASGKAYQVCTPPNENHDPRKLIDA